MALTKPVTVTGSSAATVVCDTGRTYRATAGPAAIGETTVAVTVTVLGYRGPGDASAAVTGTVTKADGTTLPLAVPSGVPVTITAGGGSAHLTGTSVGGTLGWTCGG